MEKEKMKNLSELKNLKESLDKKNDFESELLEDSTELDFENEIKSESETKTESKFKKAEVNELIKDNLENLDEEESKKTLNKNNFKSKKTKIILIAIGIILLLILLALGIAFSFIFSKTKNNKILNNIYYHNLNLGGKTVKEAEEEIRKIYDKDKDIKRNIKLNEEDEKKAKEIIGKQVEKGLLKTDGEGQEAKTPEQSAFEALSNIKVSPKEIDFEVNAKKIAEDAYKIGREGNLVQKGKEIIESILKNKKEVKEEKPKYNEETLKNLSLEIDSKIPGKTLNNIYTVVEDKLIITKGEAGLEIDEKNLANKIVEDFTNAKEGNKVEKKQDEAADEKDEEKAKIEKVIYLKTVEKKPDVIDIEKIYNEVKKEVKDASFNKEEQRIEKEVVGIDFAISLDEAKKMLEEDKEEYTIPLVLTQPKVTSSAFLNVAFPDTLSTYTSNAPGCGPDRATNLRVASNRISGTVLNPGEIFSFNRIIGSVTTAGGYRPGGVYTSRGVESGIGGGICQVVSTLYNAALMSGMEIVERHQHSYLVDYVPAGRDATMYIPTLDLKFRNSLSRPVKVVASANGGVVTVSFRGVDEGVRGEVSSVINSRTPAKVVRVPDPNLPEGQEVRSGYGIDGVSSTTYYKLTKNGTVLKNQVIHSDYYRQVGQITVRYGTKKAAPAPAPAPKPEPEPVPNPAPKPENPKPKEPTEKVGE